MGGRGPFLAGRAAGRGAALTRPLRLLAAQGSAENRYVYSGLPYYCLLHGRRAGVLDGSATRDTPHWLHEARRYTWNARRVAMLQGKGGYQYHPATVRRRWLPVPDEPVTLINTIQIYPCDIHALGRVRRVFFLDQTLRQLFRDYRLGPRLGAGVAARTLQWEQLGYDAALLVVGNSEWAARSIREDYGVPAERVAVVPQAANFDPEEYAAWETRRPAAPPDDGIMRLVFVGVEWERKGLPRLLRALRAANDGRHRLSLDVVGCRASDVPRDLRGTPHVRWHGYIDKGAAEGHFLDVVGSADVGCPLSWAEAGGNSIREFHALGLAVLGTTAGGAPEQCLDGASWLVPPDEPDDDITDRLLWLADHRDEVEARKAIAWEARESMLWDVSVRRLGALLDARSA